MKSLLKLFIVGAVAVGTNAWADGYSDYASVVSATPRYIESVSQREDCWYENQTVENRRSGGVAGPLIGGIAGGILGHQVGKGSGRDAATAVGAITGAIVGDKLSDRERSVRTERIRRCRVVDVPTTYVDGYNVTYSYRGNAYTTYTKQHPGDTIRVWITVTPSIDGYNY